MYIILRIKKTSLHILFYLFLKSSKVFRVSLKLKNQRMAILLSQTKPSNSSVTLLAVQLLGRVSGDVLNLNFYITYMTIKLYLFYLDDGKKNYLSSYRELSIFSCLNYTKYLVYPRKKPTDLTHV